MDETDTMIYLYLVRQEALFTTRLTWRHSISAPTRLAFHA